MNDKEKMYETLALGLYFRFRKEKCQACNCYNELSKLETPHAFESFVALVMENILKGNAKVTKGSGDYGVDICHTINHSDVYLAQVKCYALNKKIDHNPIAILHSNMVKDKAKGGYIVTTSDFTPNAKKYAEELNIKLINGIELAQYWLEHKQSWINEPQRKTWLDIINSEINTLNNAVLRFFKYKL